MAKRNKKKAKGGKRAKAAGRRKAAKQTRLDKLIDLQEGAIKYWSAYAQNATMLLGTGTMNPASWMKEYTTLSKNVVRDVSEFVRIVSNAGR
jgi:hypothetical protein